MVKTSYEILTKKIDTNHIKSNELLMLETKEKVTVFLII